MNRTVQLCIMSESLSNTYKMAANQDEPELRDCLAEIGWNIRQCGAIIGTKASKALKTDNSWRLRCLEKASDLIFNRKSRQCDSSSVMTTDCSKLKSATFVHDEITAYVSGQQKSQDKRLSHRC